jgi:hypothetical protein
MSFLNSEINSFCRDFAHKLSLALIANNSNRLHTLDLSNNMIEDKGKTFGFTLHKLFDFMSRETRATGSLMFAPCVLDVVEMTNNMH